MKIKVQRLQLKIVAGQTAITESIKLEPGFLARAAATVAPAPANEGNLLAVGMRDDQSVDVVPPINIGYWEPRQGGSFYDSMLPMNFETYNRNYFLTLSTSKAVSYDTEVEVVFFFETAK